MGVFIFYFTMTDAVTEQLANLDIKELDDSKTQELFEAVKALKQGKDVVVLSSAGKPLHATTDLRDEELADLATLFEDETRALEKAINMNGDRYEVHRFYPKEGLIYGRRGKGSEDSVGVALIRNFSNVLVLVSYQFPFLSARVIPMVRKELAKFE